MLYFNSDTDNYKIQGAKSVIQEGTKEEGFTNRNEEMKSWAWGRWQELGRSRVTKN